MDLKENPNIINSLILRIIKVVFSTSYFGRRVISGKADSGVTFDKVYLNRAQGHVPILGKLVDRVILNLPSLKATRNRWAFISNQILELTPKVSSDTETLRILDLASGVSRYLVDLSKSFATNFECVCVDRDLEAIQLGEIISDRTHFRFCRANLFGDTHLTRFGLKKKWKAHIAIATGLIEYLNDDLVIELLQNLRNFLVKDGYIIMSSQIKNSSKFLMENICQMRDGRPWKLLYRSHDEFCNLVKSQGFIVTNDYIDDIGMYSILTVRNQRPRSES